MVVMPDTHFPDHDQRTVSALLQFMGDYQPDVFLQIGDFWEMNPVSHWDSQRNSVEKLIKDIKGGRELFQQLLDAGGNVSSSFFTMGNHEYWLDQFLDHKIPDVVKEMSSLGVDLTTANLLGLEDQGVSVIPYNEILKIGHAHFTHGFYTGKYHASKHVAVIGGNIYYGHLESVQTHTETSIRGLKEGSSLGTMREFAKASFLRKKPVNWSHGFGIFEFRHDGSYTRYIPIIIEGEFSYNGVLYEG